MDSPSEYDSKRNWRAFYFRLRAATRHKDNKKKYVIFVLVVCGVCFWLLKRRKKKWFSSISLSVKNRTQTTCRLLFAFLFISIVSINVDRVLTYHLWMDQIRLNWFFSLFALRQSIHNTHVPFRGQAKLWYA